MFRTFISPIQHWFLSHGQCVGCGMPIKKGHERVKKNGEKLIVCKCGRGYIHSNGGKFRRARMSEMSE